MLPLLIPASFKPCSLLWRRVSGILGPGQLWFQGVIRRWLLDIGWWRKHQSNLYYHSLLLFTGVFPRHLFGFSCRVLLYRTPAPPPQMSALLDHLLWSAALQRFIFVANESYIQHSEIIVMNISLHFQKYIFGTIITSEGIHVHAFMRYREYTVCNLWCSMLTVYGLSLADATSGGSTDYLMDTAGMKYTFVTECRGNGFVEAPSQIPLSFEENWAGLVAMVDEMIVQAGPT